MTHRAWSLAFALSACGAGISAHHSLSPVYDTGRQADVDGVITQFHFVNPHPYLLVAVKEQGGTSEWRLELDNRHELVEIGMTERTLQPGDRIVARGSPGRQQARSLYVRTLERPADGLQYEQAGFSPRIRTRAR